MNQVTVPIRLPQNEYKKYRGLALEQNKSFAKLVREALRTYREAQSDKEVIKKRIAAAKWLWENRIPINVPVKELIEEGRKI